MEKLRGLNSEVVREKISKGLVNKVSRSKTKTISEIFIENIFSVFNYIIFSVIAAILFFYFRTSNFNLLLDSMGVFTIAFANTAIAIFQEIKAKRALDKVSLLLKKEVTVIRDGERKEIDNEDIVQGDLIFIQRGDQAVVDGKAVSSNHLEIDESLLTGESLPIHKKDGDEILSGSFCLSGNGYYTADKVGNESYASHITELAKKYKFIVTPLQRKINMIVKSLFVIALILVLVEIIFNPPPSFDDVSFVRKLATIIISLIPQGLVLMASVTFALGVYRISKIGAIIQKLNAIESFSNVQIVCMDKTGTLTKNMLAIEQVNCLRNGMSEEEIKDAAGSYAKYSTDKNATIRAIEKLDATESFTVIDEIPFSSETKMSLLRVKTDNGEKVFILGAYDILFDKLEEKYKSEARKIFGGKNLKLYRNLLFGEVVSEGEFSNAEDYVNNFKIEPYCIISISDQVRDDVFDAIRLFQSNGIKFKILSGDAAYAIQAVVDKIGWEVKDDEMVSGSEMNKMSDKEFKEAVMTKLVFARMRPEHKLRIIKVLQGEKLYTAMIGDGVNDLPAIKESDMGIAMEEGSQITKEVAEIVLLKNKFSLLPEIFNEGKKIVNTVNSVSKLFITKNFIIIYLSLFSLLFLWDFPLTPRRVALINIFIIGLPSFIIALKNSNTERNKNFLLDLFSFVAVSALIIVVSAYAGMFIIQAIYPAINEIQVEMMMLVIMVITSIANFYSVTLYGVDENKNLYLIYGLLTLSLFLFLAITNIDFVVFKLIKEFYEIKNLKFEYWLVTIGVSIAGAVVLFVLQMIREKLISKFWSDHRNK